MTTLPRSACRAAALLAALMVGSGPAESRPKLADPPKKLTVMQRKLSNAQLVLEGLALTDYEKIDKGADGLMACISEASWRAIKSPKYEGFSNEFQRNVEGLKKGAKKKSIDAASLSYVELTLTCVKCHQYLRDERMGAAPLVPPVAPKAVAAK